MTANLSIAVSGNHSCSPLSCPTCKLQNLIQCDGDGVAYNRAVDVYLPSQGAYMGKFALFKCTSEKCTTSPTNLEYPNKNRKMLCRCTICLKKSAGIGRVLAYEKRGRNLCKGHYQYGGDSVTEEGNQMEMSNSIVNLHTKRSALVLLDEYTERTVILF